MQQAVEAGTLEPDALSVPYSNLSSMHRQMGREQQAREFEQLATQPKATPLR